MSESRRKRQLEIIKSGQSFFHNGVNYSSKNVAELDDLPTEIELTQADSGDLHQAIKATEDEIKEKQRQLTEMKEYVASLEKGESKKAEKVEEVEESVEAAEEKVQEPEVPTGNVKPRSRK